MWEGGPPPPPSSLNFVAQIFFACMIFCTFISKILLVPRPYKHPGSTPALLSNWYLWQLSQWRKQWHFLQNLPWRWRQGGSHFSVQMHRHYGTDTCVVYWEMAQPNRNIQMRNLWVWIHNRKNIKIFNRGKPVAFVMGFLPAEYNFKFEFNLSVWTSNLNLNSCRRKTVCPDNTMNFFSLIFPCLWSSRLKINLSKNTIYSSWMSGHELKYSLCMFHVFSVVEATSSSDWQEKLVRRPGVFRAADAAGWCQLMALSIGRRALLKIWKDKMGDCRISDTRRIPHTDIHGVVHGEYWYTWCGA